MGKPMVDCSRGCDRIEELVYGSTLMGVRVVQWPIHPCCDEGGGPGLIKQGGMERGTE